MSTFPHRGYGRAAVVVLLGFVWLLSSFVGGYLLGQADALAGHRRVSEFALEIATRVGVQPPPPAASAPTVLSPTDQERFRVFWEAWSLVDREFYNRSSLDPEKMTYGAVKGMVESLGDPYTAFNTPSEKELSDASLRGTFDGIGVQVDQRDGQIRVIAPIEGTPADRAGLRPGDIIRQVDGKDLRGASLNDVVMLIRGQRGTSVTLTITRQDEPAPLTLTIERAEIKVEHVRSEMLEDGLAYLRITSFSATAAADTRTALSKLLEQQPRGLILDLRSNPGGYLSAAVEISSQFMSDGVVLYQQPTHGDRQEIRTRGQALAPDLPIAVLIDQGSASASEIVAAALRDNGRAVLIGEKSYGKGSVQTVHTLSDRSGLRVTSAVWLTPGGQPLEKNGLIPDLAVADTPEDQPDQDPQLDAAVRHLRSQA